MADDQLPPFDRYAPGAVLPGPFAHHLDAAPAQQGRDPAQLAGEAARLARDRRAVVGEGMGALADLLQQLRGSAAPAAPALHQLQDALGQDAALQRRLADLGAVPNIGGQERACGPAKRALGGSHPPGEVGHAWGALQPHRPVARQGGAGGVQQARQDPLAGGLERFPQLGLAAVGALSDSRTWIFLVDVTAQGAAICVKSLRL